MKKNSGIFFLILLIFIYALPLIIDYIATNMEESTGPNDYARIVDVDYKAIVLDEQGYGGDILVTEKLTYDIHAASINNPFWELWRDLPEDYVDGLKVDYDVISVKQINPDGSEIIYEESPKLYWDDSDYTSSKYGPFKWYHSKGPYNENLANYEAVFFYINGIYREEVTFELQYIMHNASLKYSDVSELYISMYSEDTIKYLESFNGQVLIPDKDMPKENNYLAHTYGTNSHTFEFTESDNVNPGYHTFLFNLDSSDLKFKPYNKYLEFSLLSFNEDKHIFTDYAPNNIYSNEVYLEEAKQAIEEYDNLPKEYKNKKIIFLTITSIMSILILYTTINKDKKIKNKYNFYRPKMKMKYFRDIPSDLDPYFAATLAFCKKNKKVDIGDSYSAIILNLVRKGYIELTKIVDYKKWTSNNININILYVPTLINNRYSLNSQINSQNNFQANQMVIEEKYNKNGQKLEDLSENEKNYFNLIVKYAYNNSVTMKDFQEKIAKNYDSTNSFINSVNSSIVNIGINQKYFQISDYKYVKNKYSSTGTMYIIIALIILIIGNLIIYNTRFDFAFGSLFILGLVLIISAIILKIKSKNYILLTQFGADEQAKWYALYNFLNSNTLIKEKTIIELPLWEKYLVYATAFGISEKVIKALEINCPDVANSPLLSNKYYRSANFRHYNRSFRNTTYTARSISHSSRFGGSFYGGGGRGGGGGGGGH